MGWGSRKAGPQESEHLTTRTTARGPSCALTSADVHLVEWVLGWRQHPHVGAELFGQRLQHVLGGGGAGHPDAFRGEVPGGFILKIKSHHSMELQILKGKWNDTSLKKTIPYLKKRIFKFSQVTWDASPCVAQASGPAAEHLCQQPPTRTRALS